MRGGSGKKGSIADADTSNCYADELTIAGRA